MQAVSYALFLPRLLNKDYGARSGLTLASYLTAKGPLPPPEARHLLGQLAEALSHCHANAYAHRGLRDEAVCATPRNPATMFGQYGRRESMPHSLDATTVFDRQSQWRSHNFILDRPSRRCLIQFPPPSRCEVFVQRGAVLKLGGFQHSAPVGTAWTRRSPADDGLGDVVTGRLAALALTVQVGDTDTVF